MLCTQVIAVELFGLRQGSDYGLGVDVDKSQRRTGGRRTRRFRAQALDGRAMGHGVSRVELPGSHYAYDMDLLRGRRHREPSATLLGPIAGKRARRGDEFTHIVGATLDYLKTQWPAELATVRIEVHSMPHPGLSEATLPRWTIFRDRRTIWLYRTPIERLSRLHKNDAWHKRVLVESFVFSAVAELLGTDPWQLAPERFHPH